MAKIVFNKSINMKMNGFFHILKYSRKQTKIKKYELSEVDSNEHVDTELLVKKK